MTVIETVKLNNQDPQAYLADSLNCVRGSDTANCVGLTKARCGPDAKFQVDPVTGRTVCIKVIGFLRGKWPLPAFTLGAGPSFDRLIEMCGWPCSVEISSRGGIKRHVFRHRARFW